MKASISSISTNDDGETSIMLTDVVHEKYKEIVGLELSTGGDKFVTRVDGRFIDRCHEYVFVRVTDEAARDAVIATVANIIYS